MTVLIKQSLRLGENELLYHYLPGEATKQDIADEMTELSRIGCHWVSSGPCVEFVGNSGATTMRPVSGMREWKEDQASG